MKQIKKLSLVAPHRYSALCRAMSMFFKIQTGVGSNPSSTTYSPPFFPEVKWREHITSRVVIKRNLDHAIGGGAPVSSQQHF